MRITNCNTMDAIRMIGLRCPDCFEGDGSGNNQFHSIAIFHLLSADDIRRPLDTMKSW